MGTGIVWAATTHQGCVRPANEDAILAGPRIFAVADGVGGAAGGREASAAAIAHLVRADHGGVLHVDTLNVAITAAHADLVSRRAASAMGTTLAGVAVCGDPDAEQVVMFNIGDSRVYRFRSGILTQLSEDHSVVGELLRAGSITEAEALVHPDRRVITRALGVTADLVVDFAVLDIAVGDRYLVCSDGLTNEVPDIDLAAMLTSDVAASQVVQTLLETALGRGARDNVSVVVADVIAVDSNTSVEAPTRRRSALSGTARRRGTTTPSNGAEQ